MQEQAKWIETKKEFEVNEDGNLVVKKVTYEIERKKTSKFEEKILSI